MYALIAGTVACSSSKPATPVAPSNVTPSSAPDGSTLKVTPASIQSPNFDQKLTTPVVTLTAGPATGQFASGLPLQYRFEVRTSANALVQEALVGSTTWQVTANLLPNTRYTWRVRPEYQADAGPWSGVGSFITLDPFIIDDPLTNFRTVGRQVGGRFTGEGWQSLGTTDAIDYDLATPCRDCRLEFDATNFGPMEGFSIQRDVKWLSMGDASTFSSFGAFRDHPWKMHLVQRADFPTGMEIIWRNGGNNDGGGDPGDHRIKLNETGVTFSSSRVYHFQLDWNKEGYSILINGVEVFEDGWDYWYEPAQHRISLGCYPRGESFTGIVYRNITLKKH